jgi:ribose/xylose/arabinose/galactoside ABC-type transport system permease subunit
MIRLQNHAKLKKFLKSKTFTLLILLAVVVVAIEIATKGAFLRFSNIKQILDSMIVTALLTVGAGMLMISGNLDLSTGAVGTFGAMFIAYLLTNKGLPLPLAFLVMAGTTVGMGFFNAFLINELNFQAFIATLATASLAEALSYIFSDGATIPMDSAFLTWVGTGKIANFLPVTVILLLSVFIIYGLILSKSKFGRKMYMVGGNPIAAKLAGINPKKVSYTLFMNSALLGSVSGVLLGTRVMSATSNGIKSYQFSGITAAILGGVSFGGGSGGMGGAFVGLLILTSFNNGMILLYFDTYWKQVISGALLLLALTFDYINSRRK